jgi:hypothetical protein
MSKKINRDGTKDTTKIIGSAKRAFRPLLKRRLKKNPPISSRRDRCVVVVK